MLQSSQPRSTDPEDFQELDQCVAAMAKGFPAGYHIAPHKHRRDQLLYAVSGTMRIRTSTDAWIVPPDRAVYLPAEVEHSVAMRGAVEMRTLYIAGRCRLSLPAAPVVLMVTPLLRALILALLDEPIAYQPGSRADHIAVLILDEIARAKPLDMSIPMPQDRRLLRLCEALISEPALSLTLDGWADQTGASRRTLTRLFRSECRITFTAWRQRVRFHAAVEALSRGVSVSDAARQHGYGSASAFASAFRKAFGVSPRSVVAAGSPVPMRQPGQGSSPAGGTTAPWDGSWGEGKPPDDR